MKRSEMVTIISNWLLENAPNEYEILSSYSRKLDSEDLLKIIENKGMLPPFNTDTYYKVWRDGGSGNVWDEEE